MVLAATSFGWIDWAVVGVYLALVVGIGLVCGRRRAGADGDDYFLAGRSMPMWAVALSVMATAQSAATFVGGPQQAYAGNLTYFMANLGGLLAVIIVAVLFMPAFYRHQVTSIYELLGHRYGPAAQTAASAMFLIGRVFASGARLFIVALPFALIAFGDTKPGSLLMAIAVIAVVATFYTLLGGIRAVIWTDVLQAIVYIATISVALYVLWQKIPVGVDEITTALRGAPGEDKLQILDTSFGLDRPYTLPAILIGLTLFNLAAFGTDQDLTQRMLTCRSAARGGWSAILSTLIGWPVVGLFLVMGLLLWVFYQQPGLMGDAAPVYAIDDTRTVFLNFILNEMPTGMKGMMLAGLFAASMSSMDSALNAMAAATTADFYRPLRRGLYSPRDEQRFSRTMVGVWAIALAGFACFCVFWQQREQQSGQTVIDFALGVMVFAYSGLLGVFLTALLTKRGSSASVIAALAVGFGAVLAMQGSIWSMWAPRVGLDMTLAFPWKMTIATGLSFGVCMLGKKD